MAVMHELFGKVGCDFGRKSIDFQRIEDEKLQKAMEAKALLAASKGKNKTKGTINSNR